MGSEEGLKGRFFLLLEMIGSARAGLVAWGSTNTPSNFVVHEKKERNFHFTSS